MAWLRRWMVLLKSAGVGLFATLADLAVLTILVTGFGTSPRWASAPALAVGVVVQFVGNKRWAFQNTDPRWLRQATLFVGVEALAFVANLALYDAALAVAAAALGTDAASAWYLPLRLATTNVVYLVVCFPLWSWIFAPSGDATVQKAS